MKSELLALAIILSILVGLPVAAFGYQQARTAAAGVQVVELNALAPESGGWQPDILRVTAGERVRLRIHSPAVLHGFAIGRTEIGPVDVWPGKVVEIEFSIAEPGTYTFYCTRWCSANHWRMRGTLEVTDADGDIPLPGGEPAPYIALGLDLDAEREPVAAPARLPSAARGAELGLTPPAIGPADAPVGVFAALRVAHPQPSDDALWDLTAYAWQRNTTIAALSLGRQLYARDCAACHGVDGRGEGVMARDLSEETGDLSDPTQLFGVPDALLHGKIVRGGMGTGMPSWGDIYTDEEAWALVAFLRTFTFAFPQSVE
ncbi:MAG: c-type cytochrome [Promethearchaeota archaeon]